jgi:hypothetical protein
MTASCQPLVGGIFNDEYTCLKNPNMLGNHPNIAIRIITLLSSVQFSKNICNFHQQLLIM